jgi:hypothetical protein
MLNNVLGLSFTDFGIEQGGMASLREFFLALATAQQTNIIFAIDLADGEIALAELSIILAIGMDTG